MKQTVVTRMLIVGFGWLFAMFGWSTYPSSFRLSTHALFNNDPVGWFMMVIGAIIIGMAIGAESKEE